MTTPQPSAPRSGALTGLLADQATIRIHRPNLNQFKYQLHMVLAKPEVASLPAGLTGWKPMGHRAIGVLAVRMDYDGTQILGQTIANQTHRQWMGVFDRLGVYAQALDQLALSPSLRAMAEWNTQANGYFERNVWLRSHWQWLRLQEENPAMQTRLFRLSELVAAAEARARRAQSSGRLSAKAARARQQPGLN